jgi:3D (Asp-Asp-Asp) domain-containing protein
MARSPGYKRSGPRTGINSLFPQLRALRRVKATWFALTAVMAAAVCAVALTLAPGGAAPGQRSDAAFAVSLPACAFWDTGGAAPPSRAASPLIAPQQTASAPDFSSRPSAPALTAADVNGEETISIAPVANATGYRLWRDGVLLASPSASSGASPVTVPDATPCSSAYYDVVALYNSANTDASIGQLSAPYWLQNDGSLAQGSHPGVASSGALSMTVTSYDDTGQTASGYNAQLGICATDPRVIPWGTYFQVPNYGTCYAADLGTWIQGDAVDVWLPGTQAADWGVQTENVTIEGATPARSASGQTADAPSPSQPATSVSTTASSSSPSSSAMAATSPSATATASATCSAAWTASISYTPGELVSYDGDEYVATYYSTGAPPGAPISWDVWKDDGPCATAAP